MGAIKITQGEPGPADCYYPNVGLVKFASMKVGRSRFRLAGLAVALAVVAAPQFYGRAAAQTRRNTPILDVAAMQAGKAETLLHVVVIEHKSKNLRLPVPVEDVAVSEPEIADAVPVSDKELYILGKRIGATNVLLYGRDKKLIGIVDIEVKLDTGGLARKIREASGGRDIRVDEVNGKLVLGGSSGDSQVAERAVEVATGLGPAGVVNAMKVTTPQQVMLKVRFVEATRAATRNLGIRWEFFKRSGNLAGIVGSQRGTNKFSVSPGQFAFSPIPPAMTLPLADVVAGAGGTGSPFATIITEIVNNSSAKLDAVLSALEAQNVIRQLAQPNLIAMSGESAEFNAGGEYPVPVVSAASAGALPTITIEYKEFGVFLHFTPTVLSHGVISLKLAPRVSALDFANAVMISGTVIPALTVRRAQTTVQLRDGQTFAIAGLLQANSVRNLDTLPWLGSIPVIGALFRDSEYQANETELVVLVTPYLIKPVTPGKQLKTPLDSSLAGNDIDFFLNGQPEVPKLPPATVNPLGQQQSLSGAIAPGAPGVPPAPPIVAPVAVPAPAPAPPIVAPVAVPASAPAPSPVPQGNGALYYDPATGYFVDPPANGGGK